jgi:hypothetical protein
MYIIRFQSGTRQKSSYRKCDGFTFTADPEPLCRWGLLLRMVVSACQRANLYLVGWVFPALKMADKEVREGARGREALGYPADALSSARGVGRTEPSTCVCAFVRIAKIHKALPAPQARHQGTKKVQDPQALHLPPCILLSCCKKGQKTRLEL